MDLRYVVTPIVGTVGVQFAQDFKIEVAFIDSRTSQTVADFTGENAILMSTLLSSMPTAVLEQLIDEVAVRMVAIAKGVSTDG